MNIIQNTIHKATKKSRLNILIVPFNGDFEYQLAELGHNLYVIGTENDFAEYSKKEIKRPNNLTFFPVLNNNFDKVPYITYDLIISNGRIHYNLAKKLQAIYQIPIILVEHDMPELQPWQKKQINNEILNDRPSAILAFNSVIYKHWDEIGNLFTTKQEWQNLFFKLTNGGFLNENINSI